MAKKDSRSEPVNPERDLIEASRQGAASQSPISEQKPPSLNEFGKSILRSRLLDARRVKEQADRFQQQTSHEEHSSRQFAKFLVEHGDVTRYQAERLLGGRTEGFFLGECKILDRLGAGGMGKVYLAEQLKLGRQVALKVLPAKFAQDPDYLARFRREARAAAGLKHPNVVQVYDVGEDAGTHYIIMELVRGTNLRERIKQNGPMSVEESIEVIKQVAAGLQHAHEHGVVHRDIKPSNLVLEGREVKILDLGLARKFDSGESITQETQSLGTPDYMSPEQFRDARSADIRSDLYSLGCTWYTLLCGQPPFPSGDAVAKAVAHMQQMPEPIQRLATNVPDGIAAVIKRLMAKDREDRFQTPNDLLEVLKVWWSHAVEETVVVGSSIDTSADRSGVKQTPARVAVAERDEDSQTLIRPPSTSVPTFVLYLVPVMGALVLGGAYFGIQALRKQVSNAEPIIVEIPASPSTNKNQPQSIQRKNDSSSSLTDPSSQNGSAPPVASTNSSKAGAAENETATSKPSEKTTATSPKPNPAPTAEVAKVDPKPAPEAKSKSPLPARESQTWRVGKGDGAVASLSDIWDQLISGDEIRISTAAPLDVPPLQQGDKHLVITAEGNTRPILLLQLPAVPQNGQGLWRIDRGSLMLTGVDLYVDLTDRKHADPDVVLFELNESDLHLVNTTITVIRGRVEGRSPVTAVKLVGERPWDKTAKGNPPQPVQLELRNGMVRGAQKVVFIDSRQTSIRLENSVVALPGTLIHIVHTRPLEYAHHAMTIEVAGCTLDTSGPLIMFDTRPFDLHPVKADITVRGSVICSGIVAASDMPPQVLWQSPVDDVVSTSVKWFGQDNCYLNRADCFKAKTASGPIASLVRTPDDWARQNFGQEVDWFAPATQNIKLPREPWHQRLPNDYPHPSQIARLRRTAGGSQIRVGAEPRDVAVPRVYRK